MTISPSDPDPSDRTVRFVLTDGDSGTSNAATLTIQVTALDPARYTEAYQNWAPTAAGSWEVVDLSGAPFGVPAHAVLEIAISNADADNEHWGGVRAVGSAFERRFQLHEAESGGTDAIVVHVQADALSRIETYADDIGQIQFTLLGYWVGGIYVETFDTFQAGASGTWQDHGLSSYGVAAGRVAEVVIANSDGSNWHQAGPADRRVLAEPKSGFASGGVGRHRFRHVVRYGRERRGRDGGTVCGIRCSYRLHPGRATGVRHRRGTWESDIAIPDPMVSGTWQDADLSALGLPVRSVLQVALANEDPGEVADPGPHWMGVREDGSSLDRTLHLHEAEGGGTDVVTYQVNAGDSATIELFHDEVTENLQFRRGGFLG